MNYHEIKEAIRKDIPLKWNDPNPIKGNDYTIKSIPFLNDETALISFNSGQSTADVFIHEISRVKKFTKAELKREASYHQYRGSRGSGINALFYNYEQFEGFKYCVYANKANATKKQLTDFLYDYLTGAVNETPWWIELVVAPTEAERFRVPVSGSGLNYLVKETKTENE